jgi:hypothetical protein
MARSRYFAAAGAMLRAIRPADRAILTPPASGGVQQMPATNAG